MFSQFSTFVLRDATGTRLIGDINDWHSRHRRLDLDDPAWCLILRGDASPHPSAEVADEGGHSLQNP
jgi:hypothetical protein